MNTFTRRTLLAVGVAGMLGFGAYAYAASDSGLHQPMVQKIAERFGLNQDDVQKVFDEEHQARKAEMETKFNERLSQLVADGKLTEEQKQAIIAKRAELESQH